jgi:hypothetical protein
MVLGAMLIALALIGAVLYVLAAEEETCGCPAPPTVGASLAFSTPTDSPVAEPSGIPCVGPTPSQCYAYTFRIAVLNSIIPWSDVQIVVKTSDGQVLPQGDSTQIGIAGFAVSPADGPQTDAADDVVFSVGDVEHHWTSGSGSGSTSITLTQTLVVYAAGSASDPDPLKGDIMSAIGSGPYSGEVGVAIR